MSCNLVSGCSGGVGFDVDSTPHLRHYINIFNKLYSWCRALGVGCSGEAKKSVKDPYIYRSYTYIIYILLLLLPIYNILILLNKITLKV